MQENKKNWLKYAVLFVASFFVRLLPFRAPNVEPILALGMPISKKFGALASFSFAFFSIILYDITTGTLGVWSFWTSITYGVLCLGSTLYFKDKEPNRVDFIKFAIFGTLFYDIITGFAIGPIVFKQSFTEAMIGQIPFTLWHLAGNIAFAALLSPIIYQSLVRKRQTESSLLIKNLQLKQIS